MVNGEVLLENVSKRYLLNRRRSLHLKGTLLGALRGERAVKEEFWALKDVSLNLKPGEALGVMGRNGSGKSTLLKVLSKILEPDGGRVEITGKIASLVELGAGFHPDLTGRENVFLNGAILGFGRREIQKKFDEIVSFSGIGDFIDQPVKVYSSGMYIRLGFSVAVHVNPDVLLIDEILAVGDSHFQKKCFQKIFDFRRRGKTILLVSHDLTSLERICDKAVLLEKGQVVECGRPEEVIPRYQALLLGSGETAAVSGTSQRWGSGEVKILDVLLRDRNGSPGKVFRSGEPMKVEILYRAERGIDRPLFGISFHGDEVGVLSGPNSRGQLPLTTLPAGEGRVEFEIDSLPLLTGTYRLSAAIYDSSGVQPYDHWEQAFTFHVLESTGGWAGIGLFRISGTWRVSR